MSNKNFLEMWKSSLRSSTDKQKAKLWRQTWIDIYTRRKIWHQTAGGNRIAQFFGLKIPRETTGSDHRTGDLESYEFTCGLHKPCINVPSASSLERKPSAEKRMHQFGPPYQFPNFYRKFQTASSRTPVDQWSGLVQSLVGEPIIALGNSVPAQITTSA